MCCVFASSSKGIPRYHIHTYNIPRARRITRTPQSPRKATEKEPVPVQHDETPKSTSATTAVVPESGSLLFFLKEPQKSHFTRPTPPHLKNSNKKPGGLLQQSALAVFAAQGAGRKPNTRCWPKAKHSTVQQAHSTHTSLLAMRFTLPLR